MSVQNLDDGNFQDAIGTGVTLVDLWAPWCAPCKMQGPIVEQLSEKMEGRATMAKLNVDKAPATAARYGISAIPTLLLFKDGELVQQLVGLRNETQLSEAIEAAL